MSRKTARRLEAAQPASTSVSRPGKWIALFLCWAAAAAAFYWSQRLADTLQDFLGLPFALLANDVHVGYMASAILPFFASIAIFATAALLGRRILRLLRLTMLTLREELLLGLALGLGSLSLLGFALGSSGMLSAVDVRLAFGVFAGLSLALEIYSPCWKEISAAEKVHAPLRIDAISGAAVTIIAGIGIVNLIGNLAPEYFYDSLVYHLALPQLYLIRHGFVPTPYNIYSGSPLNTEMLYTFGLALGGGIGAKLVQFWLCIGLLAGIYAWSLRFATARAGLLAMAIFQCAPMVSAQNCFSLTELNWCFLGFFAMYALMLAAEHENLGRRLSILAGILTGFAMGTRYNALAFGAVVMIVIFWLRSRSQNSYRGAVIDTILSGLAAFVLLAPWAVRNLRFYQNPIFPFFQDKIAGGLIAVDWRGLLMDAQHRNLTAALTSMHGLSDLFLCAWSHEWQGSGINSIGLPLMVGLPLIFIRKFREKPYSVALAIIGGVWLTWTLSSRLPRFVLPAVPIAACLIGASLSEQFGNSFRKLGGAALLCACAISCTEIVLPWFQSEAWKIVLGQQSKSEFLQRNHALYPTPYYAAAEFVNEHVPESSRILIFEESRSFYFNRDLIASTYFATDPFTQAVNSAATSDDIFKFLHESHIDYLVVNRAELFRRGLVSPFSSTSGKLFDQFLNAHTKLVFKKVVSKPAPADDRQWVEVYQVI